MRKAIVKHLEDRGLDVIDGTEEFTYIMMCDLSQPANKRLSALAFVGLNEVVISDAASIKKIDHAHIRGDTKLWVTPSDPDLFSKIDEALDQLDLKRRRVSFVTLIIAFALALIAMGGIWEAIHMITGTI